MPHILDVVAEACNPSNWKVQGEGLEIQGHFWLKIQLKANMGGEGKQSTFQLKASVWKLFGFVYFCQGKVCCFQAGVEVM